MLLHYYLQTYLICRPQSVTVTTSVVKQVSNIDSIDYMYQCQNKSNAHTLKVLLMG